MATLIWLIVWLVKGTPNLEWFGSWNDWAVAPLGCIVFDLFGGMDPQDPLENVEAASASLLNAEILVVPGAGHGSLQYGCLPNVAARFYSQHRLSAADRACAGKVVSPPFEIR